MNEESIAYNVAQASHEEDICHKLCDILSLHLPDAENKIWHKHPVWFLDGNPIAGYSKIKAGIRLMFWSGASFDEDELKIGSGKFMDASIIYTHIDQIDENDVSRWIEKGRQIQWDYKNVVKRKGKLVRLK